MYGNSEDRHARRRLGDFVRELEALYEEEGIPSLTRDLRDDAPVETRDSVRCLFDAWYDIARAITKIEQATAKLPAVTLEGEPRAATNGRDSSLAAPQHSHDAASPSLHPSAAEIMEREG